MKFSSLLLGGAALAVSAATASATTYAGNGAGAFGGPIGMGTLTLAANATNITGTITIGGNLAYNDELVIYIDDKTGGFNSTATLSDTGNNGDTLREATSGVGYVPATMTTAASNPQAVLNFPTGFGADAAIALSPNRAQFGSFYTLTSASAFTYGTDGTNGNMNLTPVGTNNGNGTDTYTFTVPISLLGGATSFNFVTTYLNGNSAYRSNETFGNKITDMSNAGGNPPVAAGSAGAGSASFNLGQDTGALVGVNTFTIPEPGTWAMLVGGAGSAGGPPTPPEPGLILYFCGLRGPQDW